METLFNSPPVIEVIFKYLSARDLCRLSAVCKQWHSMANVELKRRKEIAWFFQFYETENDSMNEEIKKKRVVPENSLETSTFKDAYLKQITNLRIKPVFAIAAVSHVFMHEFYEFGFDESEPQRKKRKNTRPAYGKKTLVQAMEVLLSKYLPPQTSHALLVTDGIIGSTSNYIPFEVENGVAVSGFCLPQLPGVEIYHTPITRNTDLYKELPDDTNIKCLLLFVTDRGASFSPDIMKQCASRENQNIAMGGAIVYQSESCLGNATVFYGENVEAASLIVMPQDRKEEITNKLKAFQFTRLLEHRCIAFMFTCVARGYAYHRTHNLESDIFHSLYPKVPLFGVFGTGELGVNYLPNVSIKNKELKFGKYPRNSKNYFHSYTTVFVLLAIKSLSK